ncbi:hypothetical protein BDN72DRAFT_858298 [Pluteus cervinus]|uniref:Uncharacterized protein n=1 Tax=Pluteus cervinus TaxID=181527 RepID=A0ACD3AS00_9AGAR|nr:hypothetical protein BDN72DRAFT_858298 [Pluteus cervinus]
MPVSPFAPILSSTEWYPNLCHNQHHDQQVLTIRKVRDHHAATTGVFVDLFQTDDDHGTSKSARQRFSGWGMMIRRGINYPFSPDRLRPSPSIKAVTCGFGLCFHLRRELVAAHNDELQISRFDDGTTAYVTPNDPPTVQFQVSRIDMDAEWTNRYWTEMGGLWEDKVEWVR